MFKLVMPLILLSALIPNFSYAQEACGPEELDAVLACQTEATALCLEDSSCLPEDLEEDGDSAVSGVMVHVLDNCCERATKGRIIACLRGALNSVKLGAALFAAADRSEIRSQLGQYIATVRESGSCYPDEDEEGEEELE